MLCPAREWVILGGHREFLMCNAFMLKISEGAKGMEKELDETSCTELNWLWLSLCLTASLKWRSGNSLRWPWRGQASLFPVAPSCELPCSGGFLHLPTEAPQPCGQTVTLIAAFREALSTVQGLEELELWGGEKWEKTESKEEWGPRIGWGLI